VRKPSDQSQSLGYRLSPTGLDVGSPASVARVAGFWKTGLLAANALRTFLAFIFKNALAANIGNRADCRFAICDCRLAAKALKNNKLCVALTTEARSFNVKEKGF
jgi:hypothetical protein